MGNQLIKCKKVVLVNVDREIRMLPISQGRRVVGSGALLKLLFVSEDEKTMVSIQIPYDRETADEALAMQNGYLSLDVIVNKFTP